MTTMTAIAPTGRQTAVAQLNNIGWVDMLVYAYPAANVAPQTLAILTASFAGESPDVMRLAVIAHINGSKWFPSVAELRQHIEVARRQVEAAQAQEQAAARAGRIAALRRQRHEALADAYAGIPGALARLRAIAQALADAGQAYGAAALWAKIARLEA